MKLPTGFTEYLLPLYLETQAYSHGKLSLIANTDIPKESVLKKISTVIKMRNLIQWNHWFNQLITGMLIVSCCEQTGNLYLPIEQLSPPQMTKREVFQNQDPRNSLEITTLLSDLAQKFSTSSYPIQKYETLIKLLASPNSLGIDVLKNAFDRDPNGFIHAIHYIHGNVYSFKTLLNTFGIETVREAFSNDPSGFANSIKTLSNMGKSRLQFMKVFHKLANSLVGISFLRNSFAQYPYPLTLALALLRSSIDSLVEYINENGTDINPLLSKKNIKLAINNDEVSSLNTTMGLIKLLHISAQNVIIGYSTEVTQSLAEERFPPIQYQVKPYFPLKNSSSQGHLIFVEYTEHVFTKPRTLGLSPDPFKYSLPSFASEESRSSLRNSMAIENRKIIVVTSPQPSEAQIFQEAYRKIFGDLPTAERPLVILAPRYPNPTLVSLLESNGFKAQNRDTEEEPLSLLGEQDFVVLNTYGELLKFFTVADLAIVGHDRNLFEPASQRVPILYFGGHWSNNQTAKRVLDESGGAMEINPRYLDKQILTILEEPEDIKAGLQSAVKRFEQQIFPSAQLYTLLMLTSVIFEYTEQSSVASQENASLRAL